MKKRHLIAWGAAVCAAASLVLPAAHAQTYPTKPIRLIVPFPAGGATDLFARSLSQKLGERLGQSVVIDNKPGAGGTLGSDLAAKAPADGYTLLLSTTSTHSIGPNLNPKIPYDAMRDFTPIGQVGNAPSIMLVPNSSPAKTVKEWIEYAKKNPGKLNYGSGGVGSMGQLNVEMLKASTGAFTTHIPYRGGTPLITAVLGNEVQFILDNLVIMLPHAQAGKVRALAVAADQRLPQLPDVPTLAEVGYPELNLTSWTGLAAPAGGADYGNMAVQIESPKGVKVFIDSAWISSRMRSPSVW